MHDQSSSESVFLFATESCYQYIYIHCVMISEVEAGLRASSFVVVACKASRASSVPGMERVRAERFGRALARCTRRGTLEGQTKKSLLRQVSSLNFQMSLIAI